MRLVLTLAICLYCTLTLFAQRSQEASPVIFTPATPLTAGTYIIGPAPADYLTLTAALTDLQLRGMAGAIIFALKNGDHIGAHILDSVTGLNGQSTLTIKSLSGDPDQVRIITSNVAANLIVRNVKGVILKQLSFTGFNAGTSGGMANSRIELNNVDSSTVDSCKFLNFPLVPANPGYGSIVINGGNNLQIKNSTFISGRYQIQVNTTIAPRQSTPKLTLTNNSFQNPTECATLYHNVEHFTFSKNNVKLDSSQITSTSTTPILIGNNSLHFQFEQNTFVSLAPKKPVFRASVSGNHEAKIVNNSISSRLESSNNLIEMLVYSPAQGIVDMNHNSISIQYIAGFSERQPISFAGNPNNSRYRVRNNAFKLNGEFYQGAIYRLQTASLLDSTFLNNNIYETQSPNLLDTSLIPPHHYTLSDLNAMGKEQNSQLGQVGFDSFTDLRPITFNLINRGQAATGVSVDINNILRDSLPDIGAHEYPLPLGVAIRATGLVDTDSLKNRSFTAVIDSAGILSVNQLYYRKQRDTSWIVSPAVPLGGNLYRYTIDYTHFPSPYQMNDTIFYYIVTSGTNGVASWPLGNTLTSYTRSSFYQHKNILTGTVRIGNCANANYGLAQLPNLLSTLLIADTTYLTFCDPIINLTTPLLIHLNNLQDSLATVILRPADSMTVEFRSANANIGKFISLDGPRNLHIEGDGRIRMVSTQNNIRLIGIGERSSTPASHISVKGIVFRHTSAGVTDQNSVAIICSGDNRVSNILVEDNDIFGHRYGIRFYSYIGFVDKITIRKNFIGSSTGATGAWYRAIIAVSCWEVVIERNIIKNLISASNIQLAAIDLEGNAVGETVVRDNVIENVRELGARDVIGIRLYYGAALVHGNYIKGLHSARGNVMGIYKESSEVQPRHVGIFNNTILLTDTFAGQPGQRFSSTVIALEGGTDQSFIHNNVFGNFAKSTKSADSTLSSFYKYTIGYSPGTPLRWNINNNVYLTDSTTNASLMLTTINGINRVYTLANWQQFNRFPNTERDENSRFDTLSSVPFHPLTGVPTTPLTQITSGNSKNGPNLRYSALDIVENPRPALGADIGAHQLGISSTLDFAPPSLDSSWVSPSAWPCQNGPITIFARFQDKSGTDSVFLNYQIANQTPLIMAMTRLSTTGNQSSWSATLNPVLNGAKLITYFRAKDVGGVYSSLCKGPVIDLSGTFLTLDPDTLIGLGDTLLLKSRTNIKNSLVISEITNLNQTSLFPAFPTIADRGAFKISNQSADTIQLAGIKLEFYSNQTASTTFIFPAGARIYPNGIVWVLCSSNPSVVLPEGYFYHYQPTNFYGVAWFRLGLILRDQNNQIMDAMGFQGQGSSPLFPAAAQVSVADWDGEFIMPGGVSGLRLIGEDINHAKGWTTYSVFSGTNLFGNAAELKPQDDSPTLWLTSPVHIGQQYTLIANAPGTFPIAVEKQAGGCTFRDTVVVRVSGPAPANFDLEVDSILSIQPGEHLFAARPLTVRLVNRGSQNLNNIIIYHRSGAQLVQENVNGSIAAGTSLIYTFSQNWLPPSNGLVNLCVYAKASNDSIASNDTICIDVNGSISSRPESTIAPELKIYPQPASNSCWLTWEKEADLFSFDLYSMHGKLIETMQLSPEQQSYHLDVENLAQGIYYLRFKSRDKEFTRKLLVQR